MESETERTADEGSKPWVDRLLARVRGEVEAGRPWRAKEILRGSMTAAQLVVEVEVLRAYGVLLDELGDRFEAGKYLFLSGSTEPEHAAAIEIFLTRTRKLPATALISRFPGALRRQGLGHLPDSVRSYLEERGAPVSETRRRQPHLRGQTADPPAVALLGWGCFAVFLVVTTIFLAATVTGAITILRAMF